MHAQYEYSESLELHACVYMYLCRLWIKLDNSGYSDESDAVLVMLMLPAPVQTVIDKIGHTLEDSASQLKLNTQNTHKQIQILRKIVIILSPRQ